MLSLSLLLLCRPGFAEAPGITLADAVQLAHGAPAVEAAGSAREAARAGYAQAWPSRLPSVTVQGNVLVYNEAQEMQLFESDEPLDCSGIPDPFGSLCSGFGEPIVVREQVTTSIGAQVAVPITGQIAIDRQVAAAHANFEAAQASEVAAVADAELEAQDAWFAAAQAEQQLAIAEAQAAGLAERARVAEAAFNAGTLTRNDLLLVRIASAQARQAVVQLGGYRDLGYARLGVATGNGGSPLRPEGPTDTPPARRPKSAPSWTAPSRAAPRSSRSATASRPPTPRPPPPRGPASPPSAAWACTSTPPARVLWARPTPPTSARA
jgi:outer membrane protein TolC